MKKSGALFIVALLITAGAFAQTSVELIPTAGYTFASRTDYYDTYGRVEDGLSLGGSLKVNVNRNFGIEFLYSHMNTSTGLYQYGYYGTKLAGGDLQFDYIMGGLVESFEIPNSTVHPFIGGLLGAAILTPDAQSGYSSETKFAAGAQLGMNVYMAPNLGLQFKAQMLAPVDVATGGLYFSNYYGAGGGIDTYSSIYQFSLSAGLIIGLGEVLPKPFYHPVRRGPRYHGYYY